MTHARHAPLPAVQKIAVLRANALGDYIFTLPALEALRATYPHAEIVLLGQAWHESYLPGRPGPADRVVVVPASRGVYEPPGRPEDRRALDDFFDLMMQERFDLALQLQGGGRYTNPFILRLKARFTAGFRTADAAPLDRWVAYHYWQREVLRYLEAVTLVGAQPLTFEPRLTATPADHRDSLAVLPPTNRPVALLHPGAGDGRRRWPVQCFAEVGDALVAAGARVVINGNGDEHALGEAVGDLMHRPAQLLPADLPLGAFTGVVSRCNLVVSNDSGPLHLARALGVATVGVYWCGNVIQAGPMTSHAHHVHLDWRLDCPLCGKNTMSDRCAHRASFVADVPAIDVIASALELLRQADEDLGAKKWSSNTG